MPRESKKRSDDEERIGRDVDRQGPNPLVIVGAVAVVVILVIVVGIFAFSGSNLDSISVDNPVRGKDGIDFGILTTSGNLGKWSGTVTVEIIYDNDQDEPRSVYTSEVEVTDDSGSHHVDWDEFMWGNGNYEVHASAEGKEEYSSIFVRRVVTDLEVGWNGNPVIPREKPEHSVEVSVSYMFGGTSIPRDEYPNGYELDLVVSPPQGSDITIQSQGNKYSHIERIDHDLAGEYKISGTLVNTFCHPDSPFRTLTLQTNSTFEMDAQPFAVIEGDISAQLTGGEAVVNFDAAGSWDDGSIVEYQWDFGDGATLTTSTPAAQHTYTETGSYAVTLYVVDDEQQGSDSQTGIYNIHSVTIT